MKIKLTIKEMSIEDIPAVKPEQGRNCIQYKSLIEDFMQSDTKCISLLDGTPIKENVIKILTQEIRDCIKMCGYEEQLRAVQRTLSNQVYIKKVN